MGRGSRRRAQQKFTKVFETQIEPALVAAGSKKTAKLIDPIYAAKIKERVSEVGIRVKARLLNPSTDKHGVKAKDALTDLTDKIAPLRPTDYYVIIGRGPAAVINHTTIRQSLNVPNRIDTRPVMHIGFRDPWFHYHEHGMGQPPFLLRMPGYHHPAPLDAKTVRTGLNSLVFAKSTDDELTLLKENFEVYVVEGWVAGIESAITGLGVPAKNALVAAGVDRTALEAMVGEEFPDNTATYRLLVARGPTELFFVYASHIDICGGGGRGRIMPREFAAAEAFDGVTLPPWTASYRWTTAQKRRKVINGLDGLTQATEWTDGQRICVYGAGGIGLNQIERAHDEIESGKKIYVDWFARQWLHDPTLNLRRNDTVFQDPGKDEGDNDYPFMDAGGLDHTRATSTTWNTGVKIYPGSPYWRWAHFAKIKEPAIVDGKIVIDMYPQNAPGVAEHAQPPTSVDFWLQELPLSGDPDDHFHFSDEYKDEHQEEAAIADSDDGRAFDRLILCLGQDQSLVGEPRQITVGFAVTPHEVANRMVSVETADGSIRILGASAAMFPGIMNAHAAWTRMNTWRGTLPASAVLPGFIAAGASIAYANDFFGPLRPNRNVNTAPEADLSALMQAVPALVPQATADLVAAEIVTLRRWRNDGIASLDTVLARMQTLAAGANADAQDAVNRWAVISGLLSTDYPPAVDF